MTCVKDGGAGGVSAWLSEVAELVASDVVVREVVVSEVVVSEVGTGCIVTKIADSTLSDVGWPFCNVVPMMLLSTLVLDGHGRLLW
ncbi:unnamed protein product [Clonostachys byssicola]|uniref:Uncharacterized protein n=1 Tax=Clonostachys byssicola TaxID=160290 RepID=A0A9N9XVT7_9HYPO|nr:unnamed protein product [Clonostachys byssicola]